MLIIKEYKKLNQKKDIDWESISYVLFLDYSTDGAASKKLFKFKVVYKNEKSEIITAKENSFNCDKLLSLIKPIKQPNAAEKLAKYKKMFENYEMSEYEYNLRTSQILVDVEDEKKNALSLYEKSVLKVINWYVKNLSSNEKVIKIIESYVSSHKMPSWKLEFASLPLKVYDNGLSFEIETWIKYLEIESDYIDFVKKVNNDILNRYKDFINRGHIFMKVKNNWNYTPYYPVDMPSAKPEILAVRPTKNKICFEWRYNDCSECEVFYREKGQSEFSVSSVKEDAFFPAEEEKEYEFYIKAEGEKSITRIVYSGEFPGTVVNYLHPGDNAYSFSGKFLASPSIVRLPSGDILASMDIFSGGHPQNLTKIFKSADDGKSWKYVTDLYPCFWGTLFVHEKKFTILPFQKNTAI